jgi:hypothetical protein
MELISPSSARHISRKKHADSCVSVNGYLLFRRDRSRRKCGGVAVYIRQSSTAVEYKPPIAGNNPDFEILWVKVVQSGDVTFIGALCHPPNPIYEMTHLLDYTEATVLQMQQDFPDAHLILAGDFNRLSDSEIVTRTGLTSVKSPPTRGRSRSDRLYVFDLEYSGIKVVKSAATSDHLTIVAYTGVV